MANAWFVGNPTKWVALIATQKCPPLLKRDGFNPHGAQAGEQKCRAKSPSNDLTVYLRRRLVYSERFKLAREFLVSHFAPNHLRFYQFFRCVLPYLIWQSLSHSFAWRRVHTIPSALTSCPEAARETARGCFRSYTTDVLFDAYTSLEGHFTEDKLLNKILDAGPCAERVVVMVLITRFDATELFTHGRAK